MQLSFDNAFQTLTLLRSLKKFEAHLKSFSSLNKGFIVLASSIGLVFLDLLLTQKHFFILALFDNTACGEAINEEQIDDPSKSWFLHIE